VRAGNVQLSREDRMTKSRSGPDVVDIAIVGGGVSGVYAGWRLRTQQNGGDAPPSVTVFESSDRIGGRLLSATPPGMPRTRCELGGMRYESIHTLVRSLVEHVLGLHHVPMPVADPQSRNLAYFRGTHLRLEDLATDRVPYNLSWTERGLGPGLLLVRYALDQILPGATDMSEDELLLAVRTARFEGKPLCELGFWNVLAKVLSTEGYHFAMDAGGYDCLTSNWNTADAIPFLLADFAPTVTYSRVVEGFDQVPLRIADRFQEADGTVMLEWTLESFDTAELPGGDTGVALRFHGRDETVLAKHLILALPRRSIELLQRTGPLLHPSNEDVWSLIRSVEPIPLFKLFVCYPYPWWQSVGVSTGRSLTDLPLRQCYYWGVEGEQDGADPRNRNAALLASYDDERYTTFWEGLMSVAHDRFQPGDSVGGSASWHDHQAPEPMVREIHRQLVELHGTPAAPEPYAAAFRDWQEDPFGGGVHFWKTHSRSWDVIPAIVQPKRAVPVHICGEAYSHQQGWVEGALETTELMLQTCFGLAKPDWVVPMASRGTAG